MIVTPKNWQEFQHYKDRAPPWIKLHKGLLDDMQFNALSPLAAKTLVLLWLVASEGRDGTFDNDPQRIAFRLRIPLSDAQQAILELMAAGFLIAPTDAVEDDETKTPAQLKREAHGFGSRHISDKTKREVWERDGGTCCSCGSGENIEYDHIHPVSAGGNSEPENVQLLCRPCNRKKRTKTAEQLATTAQPELRTRRTEERRAEAYKPETEAYTRFAAFWEAYPKKKSKGDAERAFAKLKPSEQLLALMLKAISQAKTSDDWRKDGGQFIPHPATWLNAKGWEDQPLGVGGEVTRKPDRYDLANAEFEAKYGKPDPMRKLLSGAVKGVPA